MYTLNSPKPCTFYYNVNTNDDMHHNSQRLTVV